MVLVRLSDSTQVARRDYANAIAPVLGMDLADVARRMDRELDQLRSGIESDSDRRWYRSVAAGSPDYGIYSSPEYVFYLWPGTVLFARPTLRWTIRAVPPSQVDYVIDVGCGIGYTTAVLVSAYPGAKVYGTNVEGCQADVARRLASDYGFTLVPDAAVLCDPARTLVFASEYFEHFYAPVEHADQVVAAAGTPRWLAIANAFGARSAGHFPEYLDRGEPVPSRGIGRRFNSALRRHGYTRVSAGWNGRPTLWTAGR